jgi:urease beta subunit
MNRLYATAAALLVLASSSVLPASASPVRLAPHLHAFFSNANIRFALRNASSAPIDLRAGDSTMTIAPGKTLDVNLPVGTKIVVATATGNRQPGDLVTQVTSVLKGTTVVLH